jgi:hypothetical protein
MNAKIDELKRQIAALERETAAQPAAPAHAGRPSRRLLLGAGLFVLFFSAAGYAWLGNVQGWAAGPAAEARPADEAHNIDGAQFEAMAARLAARLKERPDDVDGWLLLARSYEVLGHSAEAAAAYQRAQQLRPTEAAAGKSVSGEVRLSDALKASVSPDDTVFVFARAVDGPKMPLAIVRKQVRDLPLQFELDDSSAMSPATRLSTAQRVVVGARVSKSGSATPQPGDLQGMSPVVDVGRGGVRVEIAQTLR